MLKIREDVDLKELEKYGITPRYDKYTGSIYMYEGDKTIINYVDNDHNHNPYWELKTSDDNLLYDLIKADLVVKVEK